MLFDKLRKKNKKNDRPAQSANAQPSGNPDEIIRQLLNKMNPESVPALFYGASGQIPELLHRLKGALFPAPDSTGDMALQISSLNTEEEKYRMALNFYSQAWIRCHMGASTGRDLSATVSEGLRHRFSWIPENAVSRGADVCFHFIADQEPALGQVLLTGSRYVNKTDVVIPEGNIPGHTEAFSISYKKAVQYFENGRFKEAAAELEHCLKEDPGDTIARFEMVECYIRTGDLVSARKILAELKPLIRTASDRARYLRRLGVIEIDENNLDIAEIHLKESLRYENNDLAYNELAYISKLRNSVPSPAAGREKAANDKEEPAGPAQGDSEYRTASGFRFDATGAFGYIYVQDGEELCRITKRPGQWQDYTVSGPGYVWLSKFGDDTIFPGVKRYITNEEESRSVGEITYRSPGEYEIRLTGSDQIIYVSCGDGTYTFILDQKEAVRIERSDNVTDKAPEMAGLEVAPYYRARFLPGLEKRMILAILAFPALRFAG